MEGRRGACVHVRSKCGSSQPISAGPREGRTTGKKKGDGETRTVYYLSLGGE